MSFRDYSDMPNNFFTKCVSAYNKERELYDVLQMESYNKYGVQMRYYTLNISDADPLFGETNNLILERAFDYMAYYELPNEGKKVSVMGITGEDNFPIYISITHFNYASKFDSFGTSGVYEMYTPKIGDIIHSKYNNEYYNIVYVRAEDNMFLQGKHTYTIQLDVYKNKSYRYTQEMIDANKLGLDDMFVNLFGNSELTTEKDIADISNVVNVEKEKILYTIPDNCPPRDPFNDWWSEKEK